MVPTVGRIVDLCLDGHTRAAIITSAPMSIGRPLPGRPEESGYVVYLTIFIPNGILHSDGRVPYSRVPKEGHWNWPRRIEDKKGAAE